MPSPTREFDASTLSVSADGALAALDAAGAAGIELIELWTQASNAAAVQAVALHATGAPRKAARRALNVLKSRGVAIPPATRRASLLSAENKPIEVRMISPDAAGIRLLAFSRGTPGGACRATLVYLRDGQGVLQVENLMTTPSRLRDALAKALPGSGYEAVSVPLDWARDKVQKARDSHRARGIPEPLGFTSAEDLLEPAPQSTPEHPFDAEGFEFSDEDAADLASDSGGLHHLPEFRAWFPTEQAVRELLLAVGKHISPEEPLGQDAVGALLQTEMLASTDRYFTPELRQELIGWMKDAAVSVLAREGESTALRVAATIQVVGKCGLVTDPPSGVPFLRAFFEKAISAMMAQRGGKLDIPVPKRTPPEQEPSAQP